MNAAVAIDNVTEILNKILEFTDRRKQILTRNILEMNTEGFAPKDLDDDGFARVMTMALSEHIANRRLMLCDSGTIRFGSEGEFESLPVDDSRGTELLKSSSKEYLDYQVHKLSENWLNRKVTIALLRQKQS
jgi:flagellar basal body rod protein FlgB